MLLLQTFLKNSLIVMGDVIFDLWGIVSPILLQRYYKKTREAFASLVNLKISKRELLLTMNFVRNSELLTAMTTT